MPLQKFKKVNRGFTLNEGVTMKQPMLLLCTRLARTTVGNEARRRGALRSEHGGLVGNLQGAALRGSFSPIRGC